MLLLVRYGRILDISLLIADCSIKRRAKITWICKKKIKITDVFILFKSLKTISALGKRFTKQTNNFTTITFDVGFVLIKIMMYV